MIHRPAPRIPILFAMVLLAVIVIPIIPFAPETATLWPGAIVWLLLEGFLATLLFQRVDVSRVGNDVCLIRRRWPFAARRELVPIADIDRAEFEASRGRNGPACRLALKLKNGNVIPLTAAYFGRTKQQERDLEALQHLLAP